MAGQKHGKGKGCFCARLSFGDNSSLAVLFDIHSQACPVNKPLSESGDSSENGQSGEKASAVEIFSPHAPGQNHTQGKQHRTILTGLTTCFEGLRQTVIRFLHVQQSHGKNIF